MNKIICKRIYDEPSEKEGFRIFVDRLWARGVKKENARIDWWAKEITPSNELRKWFGHDPKRFAQFSAQYTAELDANPDTENFLQTVKQKITESNVTLLYAAKDTKHNHAEVLKEWIENKIGNFP